MSKHYTFRSNVIVQFRNLHDESGNRAAIHRFVGEGVGVGVLGTEDVCESDFAKCRSSLHEARVLRFHDRMFYLVDAIHLLHDKLAVELHCDSGRSPLRWCDEFCELFKGEDDGFVLGEVVGAVSEKLGDARDRAAEMVADHRPRPGGAGVPA